MDAMTTRRFFLSSAATAGTLGLMAAPAVAQTDKPAPSPNDKARDIAILRTMGATSGTILRVFLMSGSAIGIVGTFAGFLLGVLFCTYIEEVRQFLIWVTGMNLFPDTLYFLSKLPAKMEPDEVTIVVLTSLTLSILATVYPAWRAAKLDPVEALRYE